MSLNVKENDKIEDREVQLSDGSAKKLSELVSEKGLVLYFYPKDDTPGCTTQACNFRDSNSNLKDLGYAVVGVSGDSLESHEAFISKYSLTFPLIADQEHSLAKSLGIYGDKNLYGRIMQGITRTTLVLDPNLNVRKIYKSVRAKGHVPRLVKDLDTGV